MEASQDAPRILRRREVQERIGLKRSTLYRLISDSAIPAEKRFPRQVPLGPKSVGWVESEVTAWINARAAEREAA